MFIICGHVSVSVYGQISVSISFSKSPFSVCASRISFSVCALFTLLYLFFITRIFFRVLLP